MHFTKKKINAVITSIIGEEGLTLVDELTGRENVSEFDLAKKTNTDIKIIRKMLYMLYNNNLVGFIRKKDKEKGWYIYYWTILQENIQFNYYKHKREQLEKYKLRLEEEHKELFFVCPNNCVRLNFDQSMDFEFHCPECGELIIQDDNREEVKEIKRNIENIEDELKQLQEKRKVRRKHIKIKKKAVKKRIIEKNESTAKKTAERVYRKTAGKRLQKKNVKKMPAKKDAAKGIAAQKTPKSKPSKTKVVHKTLKKKKDRI